MNHKFVLGLSAICSWLLAGLLFTFASWASSGYQKAMYWSYPVSLFALFTSVAFAILTVVLIIEFLIPKK